MNTHLNKKILLVEDNIIIRMATASIIEEVGFCHLALAKNGEEALDLSLRQTYDLILMDLGLGEGLDGYQVTQKIRHEHNLNKLTPIIALTAHSQSEVQTKCLQSGMQDVICKPLEVEIFKTLLEEYAIDLSQVKCER